MKPESLVVHCLLFFVHYSLLHSFISSFYFFFPLLKINRFPFHVSRSPCPAERECRGSAFLWLFPSGGASQWRTGHPSKNSI